VREYTEKHYLPAAAIYRQRAAEKGTEAKQIVKWKHAVDQKWAVLRFGQVKIETVGRQHVFEVQVYLNDLDPKAVHVELYADGVNGDSPFRQEMKRIRDLAGAVRGFVYRASVTSGRPASDYTARVVPYYPGAAVPLEAAPILWQR
jgi:starch phosphorylase